MSHLVFYDGQCGLCDQVVQLLLKADRKNIFLFAPLQGTTAASLLQDLPEEYKGVDSLILVEDYRQSTQRFFVLGKRRSPHRLAFRRPLAFAGLDLLSPRLAL